MAVLSLLRNLPDAQIVVVIGDVAPSSIRLFKATFPSVEVVENSSDIGARSGNHQEKASQKIDDWFFLYKSLNAGQTGIFFDADVLFVQISAVDVVFEGDLLITVKDHKWPVNAGVVGVKRKVWTDNFFRRWHQLTREILEDSSLSEEAALSFGAGDQAALVQALKLFGVELGSISLGHPQNQTIQGVTFAPCSVLNEVRSIPITPSLRIVHFKTTWHEILFRERGFYAGRPAESSREMYDAWREVYRQLLEIETRSLEDIVVREIGKMQMSMVKPSPTSMFTGELAFLSRQSGFLTSML